jgi:hypothetical protein
MASRDALAQIVVGKQGSGKTYSTNEEIAIYRGKFKRPVLIIDRKGEYTNYKSVYYDPDVKDREKRAKGNPNSGHGIKSIHLPHIYRIVCFDKNQRPMDANQMVELILTIADYYKNGLLILEEMNSYIRRTIPPAFYAFLTTLRHNGVDVILHFQANGDAHPDIWSQCTTLRLHKANDSVTSIVGKRGFDADRFELARIAELAIYEKYQKGVKLKKAAMLKYGHEENFPKEVKEEINRHIYYMVYCDFDLSQISNMHPVDFRKACTIFLYQEKTQIKDLMQIEDEHGRKIYPNKNAAIQKLVSDKELVYIN